MIVRKYWNENQDSDCKNIYNLTSLVNFINILLADFTCADPESAKETVKLSVFLRFWDLRAQKVLLERL